MGLTHLDVKISNPAKLEKSWQGKFLVDTEAIDSLVPRNQLEAIDLKPEGQRTYELANGKLIRMDIAIGKLEVLGEISGATIIFGKPDTEPILGVTVLESLGLSIDPQSQTLKKLPAISLKKLIPVFEIL